MSSFRTHTFGGIIKLPEDRFWVAVVFNRHYGLTKITGISRYTDPLAIELDAVRRICIYVQSPSILTLAVPSPGTVRIIQGRGKDLVREYRPFSDSLYQRDEAYTDVRYACRCKHRIRYLRCDDPDQALEEFKMSLY